MWSQQQQHLFRRSDHRRVLCEYPVDRLAVVPPVLASTCADPCRPSGQAHGPGPCGDTIDTEVVLGGNTIWAPGSNTICWALITCDGKFGEPMTIGLPLEMTICGLVVTGAIMGK